MTTRTVQIAIVEDDVYYNRVLTKYIKTICSRDFFPELSFSITSFENAHDFVERMDDSMDILLLDYYLYNADEFEQINGADVLKIVRKNAPECKVILLTALTDPDTLQELHGHGLLAHVDKNVNSTNRVGAILQHELHQHYTQAS